MYILPKALRWKRQELNKRFYISFSQTLEHIAHQKQRRKVKLHLGDFSKLIANEAVYHKGCRASYISEKEKVPPAERDIAFKQFLEQIEANLNLGRAYDMPTLLAIYRNKLFKISSNERHTLHKTLKNAYKTTLAKKIVFFQQGSVSAPELVCSGTVDIKDAISMAFEYRQILENLSVERKISAFNNADFPVNE